MDGGDTWAPPAEGPTLLTSIAVEPGMPSTLYAGTGESGVFTLVPACADGMRDPGEECDDDNTRDGDCCTAACPLEPAGSPYNDGNAATVGNVCTAAGTCQSGPCTSARCALDAGLRSPDCSGNIPPGITKKLDKAPFGKGRRSNERPSRDIHYVTFPGKGLHIGYLPKSATRKVALKTRSWTRGLMVG